MGLSAFIPSQSQLIAISNFYFNISLVLYLGNSKLKKQVSALGKDLSAFLSLELGLI